jgi:hypothetical protein
MRVCAQWFGAVSDLASAMMQLRVDKVRIDGGIEVMKGDGVAKPKAW